MRPHGRALLGPVKRSQLYQSYASSAILHSIGSRPSVTVSSSSRYFDRLPVRRYLQYRGWSCLQDCVHRRERVHLWNGRHVKRRDLLPRLSRRRSERFEVVRRSAGPTVDYGLDTATRMSELTTGVVVATSGVNKVTESVYYLSQFARDEYQLCDT